MRQKMMKQWMALFCLVALTFTGCGKTEQTSAPDSAAKPVEETQDTKASEQEAGDEDLALLDGVDFTIDSMIITDSSDMGSQLSDDNTSVISWFYTVPRVESKSHPEAAEKINAYFDNKIIEYQNEMQHMAGEAKLYYEEWMAQCQAEGRSEEDSYFQPYDSSLWYTLMRNDEQVLSFMENNYAYLGGAHGSSAMCGVTFDAVTGECLTVDSLSENAAGFKADCVKQINQILTSQYADRMLWIEAGSEEANSYIEGQLDNGFWYMDRGGLVMIANEYDIASYADGTFQFTIPYKDMDLKEAYQNKRGTVLSCKAGSIPDATQIPMYADLDGDGSEEKICAQYYMSYDADDSAYALSINDTDYADVLRQATDYWLSPGSNYYLIDLDRNDNYQEIAIEDFGPSDDPVTFFFRYENGTLTYMGRVIASAMDTVFLGNGYLAASERMSLLETCNVSRHYHVNQSGKIEKTNEKWMTIEPFMTEGEKVHVHEILSMFEAYTEPDLNAETVELNMEDGPVYFDRTDDEKWVVIRLGDGREYYMAMENFSEIRSGEATLQVTDVFDNIFLAG